MVAWTRAFLEHRTVVLRVNDSEFSYQIRAGVPQGSPLSPTLFLVYVDDLLQQLSRVVQCQAFADDAESDGKDVNWKWPIQQRWLQFQL